MTTETTETPRKFQVYSEKSDGTSKGIIFHERPEHTLQDTIDDLNEDPNVLKFVIKKITDQWVVGETVVWGSKDDE